MTKVMKHEERLRLMFDKYKMLGYVARNIKKWEHFAFYIACLLNIIVLFSYSEYYVTAEQKLTKATYNRGRLYDPRLFYLKDQTGKTSETNESIVFITYFFSFPPRH